MEYGNVILSLQLYQILLPSLVALGRVRSFKLVMKTKDFQQCLVNLTKQEGLDAKITIERGVYKCIKGGVTIVLKID